jgi:hypothetical protein
VAAERASASACGCRENQRRWRKVQRWRGRGRRAGGDLALLRAPSRVTPRVVGFVHNELAPRRVCPTATPACGTFDRLPAGARLGRRGGRPGDRCCNKARNGSRPPRGVPSRYGQSLRIRGGAAGGSGPARSPAFTTGCRPRQAGWAASPWRGCRVRRRAAWARTRSRRRGPRARGASRRRWWCTRAGQVHELVDHGVEDGLAVGAVGELGDAQPRSGNVPCANT